MRKIRTTKVKCIKNEGKIMAITMIKVIMKIVL